MSKHRFRILSILLLLLRVASAETTVTLSTSANPVVLGSAISFVAVVSPQSATGHVTFYDGVQLVGSRPLTAGAALLQPELLLAGTHKITAYYAGDPSNPAATSNIISQTVTARRSISFFQAPSTRPAPPAFYQAVADFNADGIPDVAASLSDVGGFDVNLGNGDGSLRHTYYDPYAGGPLAAADFNDDGKVDLLGPKLYLGNGDGTFQSGIPLPVSLTAFDGGSLRDRKLLVGDFNRDGKADVAMGGSNSELIVLLGNGNGTFQSPASYPQYGTPGLKGASLVVGDFNSDGKADLLSRFDSVQSLTIMLGNGDGTFGAPKVISTLDVPGMPAIGDWNGDGITDIAYVTLTSLCIAIGHGDATFLSPTTYPITHTYSNPVLVAAADFDGDGKTDLVAGNDVFRIFSGNGDGTFVPKGPLQLIAGAVTPVDMNRDGRTDLVAFGFAYLGTARSVVATGGTPQTTVTGSAFPAQLEVTVQDDGSPMSGVPVTFFLQYSSGQVTFTPQVVNTDLSGVARTNAIAGLIPGTYTGTAKADQLSAFFTLNVIVPPPTVLTIANGNSQRVALTQVFPNPLQVKLLDSVGNPFQGATVTFTAPSSGASAILSNTTAVTDAAGLASVTAAAGTIPGSYTVVASVGNLSVTFALSNVAVTNLALGRPATQSSTLAGYGMGAAGGATDGNTEGNFFQGSVTHTNSESNPWWQVDLGSPAVVSLVNIWNRTDCCSGRLADYWIFVSNTPFTSAENPGTLQTRAATFAFHQTFAPSPSATIPTNGASGRYLRVQLSGTNPLSLAEVQVMGVAGGPASANLAIGKIATQSSTVAGYSSALASAAVDGNTDGNFFHGSVTHTNADAFSWWQVDLGSSAAIDSIAIWNRTDCCGSRLGSFWVFASNVAFSPADSLQSLLNRGATFSSFQGQAPSPSVEIPLNGVTARYVKVVSTSSDPLSLAEVQVFGTTVASPVNLALGKAATQSSTLAGYPSAVASSAVDGNTYGGFFSDSVTHTNLESNPWWQVDLGTSSRIDAIAIFNRTDACCVGRLSDFTVYISDTPFGPSDTPATLTGGYRAPGNEAITVFSFSAAHGRYVRIQLNGTNNLSLAEVQVLGAFGGPSNIATGKTAPQSGTLANYSTTGAASR